MPTEVQPRPAREERAAPNELRISRGRAILIGLILSGLATFLTLALLELVLHVANYPPKQSDHQQLFVEYDSVRGWRNTPDARGRYVTEEYDVQLEYNSHGIRGPERPYEKPANTYRVVVLGDSFIEGYAVPLEQRVSEVLERLLGQKHPERRTEVIPLGTAGYSTDQELLWLEQEGLRYQPDLVIATFYENDIWYNAQSRYWRGGKPLFVLDGDSVRVTNVPVPKLERSGTGGSLRTFIENNSKLYWIIARAIKNNPRLYAAFIRRGLAELPPEMVLDAGNQFAVPAEFYVYRSEPTPEVTHAWRTTEGLLARMRNNVQAAGAELLVFLIPFRGDIYTTEEGVRSTQSAASGWDATAVARELQQVCVRQKLHCIDPTARFRQAAAVGGEGGRLYYKFDWHWNARGHALAAEILADSIR